MQNVAVTLNSDNRIEVRVGSELRFGESYYLGLQPDRDHDEFRPATGTLQLVTEWIRWLSSLSDGQALFLPFDFSDEFTRWIHVDRDGRDLTVVFGWATVEGWAISASDLSEHIHGLPGFMPDEPLHRQTLYLPRFIADLRFSQQRLRQQASLESLQTDPDNHIKI
ncbi:MAG: hypothetical protein ACK58L_12550 [Planctomycetota bacterium]